MEKLMVSNLQNGKENSVSNDFLIEAVTDWIDQKMTLTL